jgi:hypothetical protein
MNLIKYILAAGAVAAICANIAYHHYVKTAPQIYTYSHIPMPLDPAIHAYYAQPDQIKGIPIVKITEQYLGSAELRGPILNCFVDLGTDGIGIIDLMEYCPVGFVSPKKDKVIGVDDGHFPRPISLRE